MLVTTALAAPKETEILLNLWQSYMHDLAEFRTSIIQSEGRYRDDRLLTYLAYEDHWLFLIRSKSEIAGFALVRKSKPRTYLMGEFFIVQKFRQTGVGSIAVSQILQKFTGHWEIPFQNENPKASAFWRGTISKLGFTATELVLPVAENPELPPDIWLRFTSQFGREDYDSQDS